MNKELKIEALVESFGNLNGCFHNPDSDAYRLKSPLLLKSFARPGRHEVDEQGRRVFPSMLSGYKASTFDMQLKVNGQSRAALKPETDTITNLCRVYGVTERLGMTQIVRYLRRALKDESISLDTKLEYFLK